MCRKVLRWLSPLVASATLCLATAFPQSPPAATGPAAGPATGSPSRIPVRTEEAPTAPVVEHGPPAVQYFVALLCAGAVMIVVCYPSRKS